MILEIPLQFQQPKNILAVEKFECIISPSFIKLFISFRTVILLFIADNFLFLELLLFLYLSLFLLLLLL